MRLRRLQQEMGLQLRIEWKAFPLRPAPDPSVNFKGTYREEAWKRCAAMAEPDGLIYNMWSRADYPNCSLPPLQAAKCAALQGEDLFQRVHLALYEAFFTRGRNISIPDEVFEVVSDAGADMARFLADYESEKAREWVLQDYEQAVSRDGVRAIPTVVMEGDKRLVGLVSAAEYRRALEAASSG